MPYMTYSQLKNSATMRMKPVIGKLLGAAALSLGLMALISQVTSFATLFPIPFAVRILLYFLLTLLGNTLYGMLRAGTHYLYLKFYCGRPFSAGDLFYAFTNRTKTCLGLSFAISLIDLIPTIPVSIFMLRFNEITQHMELEALSSAAAAEFTMPPELMRTMTILLFCCTPALILTTVFGLIYSQAYYLMLDFPAFSVRQLLRKSRLLMRGHKGRLFYIQVCFLPLFLLCMLTCGIGLLWIMPFIYAVQTEFYLDLVTKRRIPG